MTTTTEERTKITRPGAGFAVDPGRVMAMRFRRLLKRPQMSARIAALGLTDEDGRPVRLGRDAIGKIETGQRKPSLDALRAICAVLDCTPDDLTPGGPVITLPKAARERQARLAHNGELREFAIERGLRYKNPNTGRVYYGKKLREAYARYVDFKLAQSAGDEDAIRAANAAFSSALTAVPRAAAGENRDDDDETGELLAS